MSAETSTGKSRLELLGEYFMGMSDVHKAARGINRLLSQMDVPFAIAGGLAVNEHGLRRATEDVDVLLRPEGLAAFKERWLGRGYLERFKGSRGLKDTINQVKIDVLLTGGYPGDGKPKEYTFPDPAEVAEEGSEGLRVINLKTLIEMKLASFITSPHRFQDMGDAVRVIRINELPADYGQTLHPYVQEKYQEAWRHAQVPDDEY